MSIGFQAFSGAGRRLGTDAAEADEVSAEDRVGVEEVNEVGSHDPVEGVNAWQQDPVEEVNEDDASTDAPDSDFEKMLKWESDLESAAIVVESWICSIRPDAYTDQILAKLQDLTLAIAEQLSALQFMINESVDLVWTAELQGKCQELLARYNEVAPMAKVLVENCRPWFNGICVPERDSDCSPVIDVDAPEDDGDDEAAGDSEAAEPGWTIEAPEDRKRAKR